MMYVRGHIFLLLAIMLIVAVGRRIERRFGPRLSAAIDAHPAVALVVMPGVCAIVIGTVLALAMVLEISFGLSR
jgi:hypothetical protein